MKLSNEKKNVKINEKSVQNKKWNLPKKVQRKIIIMMQRQFELKIE